MKLLALLLMITTTVSAASTSSSFTTKSSSKDMVNFNFRLPKKMNFSYRVETNLQGSMKLKALGRQLDVDLGTMTGKTFAMAYKDRFDKELLYEVGTSFTKIDPSGTDDYIENIKFEGNFIKTINENWSAFAGANIGKFTSGAYVVDADPGIGFQFGTKFKLDKRATLDLRYWESNNYGSGSDDGLDFSYDLNVRSTSLGFSYALN